MIEQLSELSRTCSCQTRILDKGPRRKWCKRSVQNYISSPCGQIRTGHIIEFITNGVPLISYPQHAGFLPRSPVLSITRLVVNSKTRTVPRASRNGRLRGPGFAGLLAWRGARSYPGPGPRPSLSAFAERALRGWGTRRNPRPGIPTPGDIAIYVVIVLVRISTVQ